MSAFACPSPYCAPETPGPKRTLSFLHELWLSEGSKRDWPYFARWHYRSHKLGPVKRVTLLWHGERPIGICVFCAPAAQLRLRNQFFGWSVVRGPLSVAKKRSQPSAPGMQRTTDNGQRTFLKMLKMLNRTIWVLSRVVLHPTYRGAGIAAAFVRQSCATCRVPWIETLSVMGHVNPFFERAGFVRVGVVEKQARRDPANYARIYGGRHALSAETVRKSLHAQPVYYVLDNRKGLVNAATRMIASKRHR